MQIMLHFMWMNFQSVWFNRIFECAHLHYFLHMALLSDQFHQKYQYGSSAFNRKS